MTTPQTSSQTASPTPVEPTAPAPVPATHTAVVPETPAPAPAPAKPRAPKAAAKPPVKAQKKARAKPSAKTPGKAPVKAGSKKTGDLAAASADAGKAQVAGKKIEKTAKLKEKLVRDSFTMPQKDFALIAVLKDRALGFKRPTKKSELLRAGLQVLAALPAPALRAALDALVPLKAGRPKRTD